MSERLDRRGFVVLGAGALAVLAAPPLLRPRERLVRRTVPVMGTVADIAVPTRYRSWAHAAMDAAVAELHRTEALMSRFRVDSDVGRFNRADTGTRVSVSPETAEVVAAALGWAQATDGHFDPCLARLTELWSRDGQSEPPAGALIALFAGRELWKGVDPTKVGERDGLLKLDRDAALDLGGIAKGFGADLAARALREYGVERGLVNVGGDLVALGTGPGGRPWRIGVRDPAYPTRVRAELDLEDRALATSGDYLRYFEHGGRRYHHLLDPGTGEPAQAGLHTVTVSAPDAMTADAAATTAFALGVDRAARLPVVERAGVLIVDTG